jgi:hypothetical protein
MGCSGTTNRREDDAVFKLQLFPWKNLLAGTAICVVLVLVLNADVPRGWHLAGSKPREYEAGVDTGQAYRGHASAILESKRASVDGFGTLMQSVNAEPYQGNTIRLSGLVKSEEVARWAGLWMRVDKGTETLAFDNMQNRPIKGTTGWQRYYVVLAVSKDATRIAFGILLDGPGEVWLNSTKFEVVGLGPPATGPLEGRLPEPVNLEFNE